MMHRWLWATLAGMGLGTLGLAAYRVVHDRRIRRIENRLFGDTSPKGSLPDCFSADHLAGLPEPARRYLRHAITIGTPLADACRLTLRGSMCPAPGQPRLSLTATEVLAPREGFVWTAKSRMYGVPLHVRDHYAAETGGVEVLLLGVLPIPVGSGADVTRSSRGRLVAEAVWCPTALVHPSVTWTSAGPDRARYTLSVDGEPITVTLDLDADGALRAVSLPRWGDVAGPPQLLPYGFRVEAEARFDGVTLPTHVTGGWMYGTDAFDSTSASTFEVQNARFSTG